jgi:hypothetical protein
MGDLHLSLILGAEDRDRDDPVSQAEFERAYEALNPRCGFSPRVLVRKAAGANTSMVGEYLIPTAQVVLPVLGVVVASWLQGRAGHSNVGVGSPRGRPPPECEALGQRPGSIPARTYSLALVTKPNQSAIIHRSRRASALTHNIRLEERRAASRKARGRGRRLA